jgi:sigma-B regulation protein RsbU (phosphoserine phosphatase)
VSGPELSPEPVGEAPCGFLATTPDGVITHANATLLSWTGHAAEDVVGRRFSALLTAGGRIYHDTHYAPMLAMGGEVKAVALEFLRADGGVLPVLVNAVLDRDLDGRARAIRVAVFDAADRRSYERELLSAKRQAEESEARAVALARTLQKTFVPPVPPAIPDLEIAAGYRPAGRGDEVGGDFYDAFQVGDSWLIVLGDVSGKGVDAAVVTTLVRHTVRALAVHSTLPSKILSGLNKVLLDHESDRFCTLVVMSLARSDRRWRLTTSSGGHPLPVLVRDGGSGGLGEPGSLVGAFDDPRFVDTEVGLVPGDRVVLFTDGVTEGRHEDQFYGAERLHRLLRTPSHDAAELAHAVVDDAVDFQGDFPRDDIAVVVIRVPADGPSHDVRAQ